MSRQGRVPRVSDSSRVCRNPSEDLVKSYLLAARKLVKDDKIVKAHGMYVAYLDAIRARCDERTKKEYLDLVCEIAYVLELQNEFEEVMKCYIQALNFFPNDPVISNKLGLYLFNIREIDAAKKYIEAALTYNKDYLPAEINLMHIQWTEVPRWHFRMLNDYHRNKAYFDAISKAIKQHNHKYVCDIGSGCGLLSLFASYQNDTRVVAIEQSKLLSEMNEKICQANNITNITVVNKHSLDLLPPPYKATLLVCEIFDVALFGEGALETLVHALQNLVTKNVQIIPAKATVFAAGINSNEILRNYRYLNTIPYFEMHNLCLRDRDPDPYEAENLNERNVDFITDVEAVVEVEFSNLEQIKELSDGYTQVISLKCIKKGTIQAIAVWFDLHLDDEITITTNPFKPDRVKCWEQAVFFLDHPISVDEGEVLCLEMHIEVAQLSFKVINRNVDCPRCFTVSKEVIKFLNDQELVKTIMHLISAYHRDNPFTILDLNPFPLFGMWMTQYSPFAKLLHLYQDEHDMELLNHLFQVNNIDSKQYACVDVKHVAQFMEMMQMVDIVYYDPVKFSGALDRGYIRQTILQKMTPQLLPETYSIEFSLVGCEYLTYCNAVNDGNCLNFRIGEFMNKHMGFEHPELEDIRKYPNTEQLSLPYSVKLNDLKNSKYKVTLIVSKAGTINGIYCWYLLGFLQGIKYSTLESVSHKKTCFLVENPKTVNRGDHVTVMIHKHDEFIKLSIV